MFPRQDSVLQEDVRIIPSKQIIQTLKEFKKSIAPYDVLNHSQFKRFNHYIKDTVKPLFNIEENQRPALKISVLELNKQRALSAEIEKRTKTFDKSFQEHENKEQSLHRELDQLHDQILEDQGEQMIASLRNLVDDQRIQLQILDLSREIDNKIASMGCCFTIFSRTPALISQLQAKRETLRATRMGLASNDAEKFYGALKTYVLQRRAEIKTELDALADTAPVNDIDELRRSLAESIAGIDHKWSNHYYRLSHEAMIHCVKIYALLIKMDKSLLEDKSEHKSGDGRPDYQKRLSAQKVLKKFKHDLHRHLKNFYCHDQLNDSRMEFETCYARYRLLNSSVRQSFLGQDQVPDVVFHHLFPLDENFKMASPRESRQ